MLVSNCNCQVLIEFQCALDSLITVLPNMELKPHAANEKAWVYSTPADYADEESKPETLAIRFANPESKRFFLLLS
jgi:hypothetical protein